MKVFVWKYLDQVSCSYHTEGGLMVVAENLEDAVRLAEQDNSVVVGEVLPDYVYDTSDTATPVVVVFPDAGCC